MPNWCENRLIINTENTEDIQKIISYMIGYDVSRLKGVECPETKLKEDINSRPYMIAEEQYSFKDNLPYAILSRLDNAEFGFSWLVPLLKNTVGEQYEKWGTKWGPSVLMSGVSVLEEAHDIVNNSGTYYDLWFDTPWGPADKWFETLCNNFGDLGQFNWYYLEPGLLLAGEMYNEGEKMIDNFIKDKEAPLETYKIIKEMGWDSDKDTMKHFLSPYEIIGEDD